jgi:hypothetical protein
MKKANFIRALIRVPCPGSGQKSKYSHHYINLKNIIYEN